MDRARSSDLLSRRRFLTDATLACAACAICPRASGALFTAAAEPVAADWWKPAEGGRVQCRLCPRECTVPDGGRGYCRGRENRKGRYYSIVHSHPCAANLDPIEKKPFFHVLPGRSAYSIATVGCNLHCKFCQNFDISQARPEDVNAPLRTPAQVADDALRARADVLAFTYSEPTIFYEFVRDCAKAAKEKGIRSVVVSNGFIQAEPLQAVAPLLAAYKVDLKAFTDDFYRGTCDGWIDPVKETMKRLVKLGVWLEIVTLLIPTLNDKPDDLKALAGWVVKELGPDVPVHFTRFTPLYRLRNLPPTPPETLLQARRIAMQEGCRFVYTGNVPGLEGQDTLCPNCKATVIRRYGYRADTAGLADGACRACKTKIPGVWK